MVKWEEKRMDEISSKITDGSHNPPKKVEVGYPMFSGRNLIDGKLDFSNPSRFVDELGFQKENKRTNIQAGDIFLSIVGSIGLTAVVPDHFEPFVIQRSIALIRTDENSEFVRYYFESPSFQKYLEKEARGAAQKGVYLKTLRGTKISIPQLPEQQRIVTKLDGLFAKIDQAIGFLEENIKHTQALMGSVLDEEFGKLEKKFGKVELVTLCDKITDGSHHSPKAIENGTIPYVTVRDVSWEGEIDTINCKKISKADFIELERNGCKPLMGDVLLSKDGTVGKIAIVDFDMDWVVLSSLAIIRATKNKLNPTYLSWMLKTPRIQDLAIGLKTGAAIKRIVLRTIKTIEIPAPKNIKDQEKISQYFDDLNKPYQNLVETHIQKLNHLKALKSSLLDQAFKGEL